MKTLLLRSKKRDVLGDFDENYRKDGLLPVLPNEWQVLRNAGTCIACGLCDAQEGERIAKSRGVYRGLMYFVLAGGRSMPDYKLVARSIADVPLEAFVEGERVCPVGVQLVELRGLVLEHGQRG